MDEVTKSKKSRRYGVGAAFILFLAGVAGFTLDFKTSNLTSRQRQLYFQFQATNRYLTFPIAFDDLSSGLLWIDRQADARALITIPGSVIVSPSIDSRDQKIIFVKNDLPTAVNQIVQCSLPDWRCDTILKSDFSIRSPVDLGDGRILFAASEFAPGLDGKKRYATYNFYLITAKRELKKLGNFDFFHLDDLQYVDGAIVFSAIEKDRFVGSSLYKIKCDLGNDDALILGNKIEQLNLWSGTSTKISSSPDLRLVAFLAFGDNPSYDLIIQRANSPSQILDSKVFGFSRPSVIGTSVIVNKFVGDNAEVTEIRPDRTVNTVFQIDVSASAIKSLPNIQPLFNR
jgi:hypothetical protein